MMDLEAYQQKVDDWIKSHGVRYFDERTNMMILMEEVGELASLMARHYGEQSFKDQKNDLDIEGLISDEMADVFFVLTCLCNQMNLNLETIIQRNFEKKTQRDSQRHKKNTKLSDK